MEDFDYELEEIAKNINEMSEADEGFMERFNKNREKYDKKLLLENLTEEDKEALRLGRELLEKKSNTIWQRIKRWLFNMIK